MDPFDSSPCRRFGIAPKGETHPCLASHWGERQCPVNEKCREWLETRERQMYRLGYPYAAWVVRKRWFGLRTECALRFLREEPRGQDLAQLYGPGTVRIARAL